jgi:hypothetical protein
VAPGSYFHVADFFDLLERCVFADEIALVLSQFGEFGFLCFFFTFLLFG